jgi:hypothetical protein
LISEIDHSAELGPLITERDLAEREAQKKRSYERAAATRNRKAKAKAERLAEKDRRIAELEEQLAAQPALSVTS